MDDIDRFLARQNAQPQAPQEMDDIDRFLARQDAAPEQVGIDRRAAIAAREKELYGQRMDRGTIERTLAEEFQRTEAQEVQDWGQESAAQRFVDSAGSQLAKGAHNVANKVDNFVSDRFGDDTKGGGIIDDAKYAERDRKNDLMAEHAGIAGAAGRIAGDSLLTAPVDLLGGGALRLAGKGILGTKKALEHAKAVKQASDRYTNLAKAKLGPLKKARSDAQLLHQQKKDYWRSLREDRDTVMEAADKYRKDGPSKEAHALDLQAGAQTKHLKATQDEKNKLSRAARKANKDYQDAAAAKRAQAGGPKKDLKNRIKKDIRAVGPLEHPSIPRQVLGRTVAGNTLGGALGGGASAAILADEGTSGEAALGGAMYGGVAGKAQGAVNQTAGLAATVAQRVPKIASYFEKSGRKRALLRATGATAGKYKESIIDTLQAVGDNVNPGGLARTINQIRNVGAGNAGAEAARQEQYQ